MSPSGRPITAALGGAGNAVAAPLVTCGNCHGGDGRGRPEGGLEPPDLTWHALSKPYGSTDRRGRHRPAYTEALVGRAITMGLDSAGRRLGVGMPRYQFAVQDLADLVAYLRVLGTALDPGLSPETIRLGVLLPPEPDAPELRDALARTLTAAAAAINERGGIFNRRILLEFQDMPAVAARWQRQPAFALVDASLTVMAEDLAQVVRDGEVPLIGPFAPQESSASPQRHVFSIHPGLDAQARALALAALRQSSPRASAILQADDRASARAADAVADQWSRGGWDEPERVIVPEEGVDLARLIARLSARPTEVLVYLGPPALTRPLLLAADRAAWHPVIYLPGARTGGDLLDLPAAFDGRVFLALPYLPSDVTRSGRDEYERLRSSYDLPRHHEAVQMATLAAAKVLEEGLRRCGRDLSRSRLVDELERLSEFPTGFSRPVTFGPNRRVGSFGAYVLAIDLAKQRLQPREGWIDLGALP